MPRQTLFSDEEFATALLVLGPEPKKGATVGGPQDWWNQWLAKQEYQEAVQKWAKDRFGDSAKGDHFTYHFFQYQARLRAERTRAGVITGRLRHEQKLQGL